MSVTLEAAQLGAKLIDAALSEGGYAGVVRPASAEKRRRGAGVSIPVSAKVPHGVSRKAMWLAALHLYGPERPVVCMSHRPAIDDWSRCPKYPVGALLAGAVEGCQP